MLDPIDTAAKLDQARRVHATAVERHDEATVRRPVPQTVARPWHASAQRLISDAAAGTPINAADLQRARVALEDATDTLDLHRAISASALAAVHRAEVEALNATVADHRARTDAARLAAVAAAEQVDAAIEKARGELAAFFDRLADLRDLADEAGAHNQHTLPAALVANKVLADLHSAEHPRMAAVPVARATLAIAIIRDGGNSVIGEGATAVHSLTAFAAGLAPAPAVAPATLKAA